MSDDQSRSYYDTFAAGYEEGRHEGYHRWLDERSFDLIREHARNRRTLEVGCGTGLILRETDDVAAHATGVDLSHGMLRLAQRRQLSVIQGSATKLPLPNDAFDLVYSFKVLAHVPDLGQALREMARVTRPGGTLVLEFYNRASLRYLVRRLRPAGRIGPETTEKDVYTRFHRLDELQALLPENLRLLDVHGLRLATLLPQVFKVPIVGRAWAGLEDLLSRSPLRRFGGFLVLVARKSEEPPVSGGPSAFESR